MFHFEMEIKSCPDVYSPGEDSILLAEEINPNPDDRVLDVGTGTGFLALKAAKRAKYVLAMDINEKAVECARTNAELNGLDNIQVLKSDLFERVEGTFELILFNPPYLPTEPWEPVDDYALSWDGGGDGRKVINRFLDEVSNYLAPGGRIITLGSSLSDYNKTIEILEEKYFDVNVLSRKKLDFEELVVISAFL